MPMWDRRAVECGGPRVVRASQLLDAVTATIIAGKLVMPKVTLPSFQTFLWNHPSWEKDTGKKAKEGLGLVIVKWLATGVLKYVVWNDSMPVLLQQCKEVPKGTVPFYRLALPTSRAQTGEHITRQLHSLAARDFRRVSLSALGQLRREAASRGRTAPSA